MFKRTGPVSVTTETVQEDLAAISAVIDALGTVSDRAECAKAALDAVRSGFGWAYGSYWEVRDGALRFVTESGSVDEKFRAVTMSASFAEGVGLSGRAWRRRDLVTVDDLSALTDCVRAPAARQAGVRSGACFPVIVAGQVMGTMDFFSNDLVALSQTRTATLRTVGRLVSQTLARLAQAQAERESAADARAVSAVLTELGRHSTSDDLARAALDTVRSAFGWAYGSYWVIDGDRLRFSVESGSVNEEFRAVTATASFAEGVGLSGRAWRKRDLVFVADLGDLTDCVRAPAARRAGVKSGVCFPIIVSGRVLGTMDFFTTEALDLEPGRLEALRSTGHLLSAALEKTLGIEESRQAASVLSSGITELSASAGQASEIASKGVRGSEESEARLLNLQATSEQIGSIVNTIASIAEQTNLLALNATIEAARAGSAGKGFAVVAGEVKDLAAGTSKATKAITEQIEGIQTEIREVVESVVNIRHVVTEIDTVQGEVARVLAEQAETGRGDATGPADLKRSLTKELASRIIEHMFESAGGGPDGIVGLAPACTQGFRVEVCWCAVISKQLDNLCVTTPRPLMPGR